jgi:methionyl-tRNA synthetase
MARAHSKDFAMSSTIFISTSIPYVNGSPHVGFAWELLIADTLARYHRRRGARVFFLTGTDDNSLKNVRAAERAQVPTDAFVRAQGDRFVALGAALGLSNDDLIRTAFDPRHEPAVARLFRACQAAGDVYEQTYRGTYCVGCEQFYTPAELPDGRCPEHDAALEQIEESNYFFRLSRHDQALAERIESGALRITPEGYARDVQRWFEVGLADFSISRSRARARGWGIGVPGDPAQIVYVWFDALANYVSALGYGTNAEAYRELWQSSDRRIHVIGKNLTRFHCVYWPGILASAGVAGPTDVVVHGFLTVAGRKIGKSLGNSSGSIDPFELLEQVGRDRLRYYLLGQFPLGKDGDFSLPALVRACNAGLSDQLGNLLQRTLTLLEQNCGGRIPPPRSGRSPLAEQALEVARRVSVHLDAAAPDRALCALDELVHACNLFVSRSEPWRLARSARESTNAAERTASAAQLGVVLGEVATALLWIGGLLEPFLPDAAGRLARALGTPLPNPYRAPEHIAWGEIGAGAGVQRGDVLFPRLPVAKRG